MARPVLLVGTVPAFQSRLAEALRSHGLDIVLARTDLEAVARQRQLHADIVLLDLDGRMPIAELLRDLHAIAPATRIIGLTDDISGGPDTDDAPAGLARILHKPEAEDRITALITAFRTAPTGAGTAPVADDTAMAGSSVAFRSALALIDNTAATDAPVLLIGESGTGKSLAARRIHARSPRAAQTVLLAHIESHEANRHDAPRLVATGYRGPEQLANESVVRRDLIYRLAEITIHLPPLRDRDGDAVEIAGLFLDDLAQTQDRPPMTISAEVQQLLLDHDWPGNLRELLNMLRTATLAEADSQIALDALPAHFLRLIRAPQDNEPPSADCWKGSTLAEIERYVIEQSLLAAGGSVPRAARDLDVSPSTIYRKLENWARSDTEDETKG